MHILSPHGMETSRMEKFSERREVVGVVFLVVVSIILCDKKWVAYDDGRRNLSIRQPRAVPLQL